MESNKAIRRQALQIASGGVQSKKSITRQYKRAQGDTAGFTSALVSLLKGEQGTAGAAYGQAVSQQQQIDAAARDQLGQLGENYGGAAVKVGAAGDSAVSGLLAGQAAASDYASRQPGIAAGRGALAQTALENSLSDALKQRQEAIHQAYGPAYQSVRQNAFNEAMGLQQLGLSRQQLALSQRSEAFQEGMAQQNFAEQQREFNISERDKRRAARTGAAGSGLTPNEFYGQIGDATALVSPKPQMTTVPTYKKVTYQAPDGQGGKVNKVRWVRTGSKQVPVDGQDTRNWAQQGMNFNDAISQLVGSGINQQVAQFVLMNLYERYAQAPEGSNAGRAYNSYLAATGRTSGSYTSGGNRSTSRRRGERR